MKAQPAIRGSYRAVTVDGRKYYTTRTKVAFLLFRQPDLLFISTATVSEVVGYCFSDRRIFEI